jgi:hypothetical protein
MDLFSYLADHRTWICIPCGTSVKPKHYLAHLARWHADHPELGSSRKARTLFADELMLKTPIDPDSPCFQLPPPGLLALPHLPIYDGLSCPACSYICTSKATKEKHFRTQYTELKRVKGRPSRAAAATAPQWHQVSCQRLFVRGTRSQFFAVISPAEAKEDEDMKRRQRMAANLSKAEYIRTQIDEALEQGNQETIVLEDRILDNAALTEVSPWLEMTRWPKYLQGHSFAEVALLASPANPASEPLLVEFQVSLDRVVEEAHSSIRNDKVNVFDQARINSFI